MSETKPYDFEGRFNFIEERRRMEKVRAYEEWFIRNGTPAEVVEGYDDDAWQMIWQMARGEMPGLLLPSDTSKSIIVSRLKRAAA